MGTLAELSRFIAIIERHCDNGASEIGETRGTSSNTGSLLTKRNEPEKETNRNSGLDGRRGDWCYVVYPHQTRRDSPWSGLARRGGPDAPLSEAVGICPPRP